MPKSKTPTKGAGVSDAIKQAHTATSNAASAVSSAIEKARGALDDCDAEIARLEEQQGAIAGAPPTRAEAITEMRERIDTAAAEGHRHLDQVAEQLARPGGAARWEPADDLQRWAPGTHTWTVNKPVVLAVIGNALKTELERRIQADATFDGDNVVTAEQRTKRLAELDAEIAEAEKRRDQLERELADAGFYPEAAAPAAPSGGDRGERALREQHDRQRQETNRALQRAGVTERAQPRVIHAFDPVRRVGVGED